MTPENKPAKLLMLLSDKSFCKTCHLGSDCKRFIFSYISRMLPDSWIYHVHKQSPRQMDVHMLYMFLHYSLTLKQLGLSVKHHRHHNDDGHHRVFFFVFC